MSMQNRIGALLLALVVATAAVPAAHSQVSDAPFSVSGGSTSGAPGGSVLVPFTLTWEHPDAVSLLGLGFWLYGSASLQVGGSEAFTTDPSVPDFPGVGNPPLPASSVNYAWLDSSFSPLALQFGDSLRIDVPGLIAADDSLVGQSLPMQLVIIELVGEFVDTGELFLYPPDIGDGETVGVSGIADVRVIAGSTGTVPAPGSLPLLIAGALLLLAGVRTRRSGGASGFAASRRAS